MLGPGLSVHVEVIKQLLNGELPVLPRLNWGVVDVRDVADLRVRAMVEPAAAGERFLATAGAMSLPQVASLLRAGEPSVRGGRPGPRCGAKCVEREGARVLGRQARPIEETILDAANSLTALSLLRGTARTAAWRAPVMAAPT